MAAEIIKQHGQIIGDELKAMGKDKEVARLLENSHLARRYEDLVDLVERNRERPILWRMASTARVARPHLP